MPFLKSQFDHQQLSIPDSIIPLYWVESLGEVTAGYNFAPTVSLGQYCASYPWRMRSPSGRKVQKNHGNAHYSRSEGYFQLAEGFLGFEGPTPEVVALHGQSSIRSNQSGVVWNVLSIIVCKHKEALNSVELYRMGPVEHSGLLQRVHEQTMARNQVPKKGQAGTFKEALL